VSSSTTPVKCFDTSASGSVRTPMAGSWITMERDVTERSTT